MKDKKQIQKLFTSISKNYDLLNHLFSFGTDHFWRHMAVDRMPDKGPYLDLCAGTLGLSLALLKFRKVKDWITALDFCPAMLLEGKERLITKKDHSFLERIEILTGDAEHLPIKDNVYQGIMIGFGFRNLTNRKAGLKEILRVLKPGGRLVILEFSNPKAPFFRQLYYFYFCRILPPLGNFFSRRYPAYDHLRDSVLAFPNQEELASIMLDIGFIKVHYQPLTLGVVVLHWGEKPR